MMGFLGDSDGKESACNVVPGSEDPLEKGMAIHSLENSVDRGAWWAIVHRVAKSRT